MAQAEDTELRDLVIEALERNGSLAKIRALLRANIFLAFEDECGNIKQNINLDKILKLPEGRLALSIVHEFLEYCCLRNTLFVYTSESRQGNEYNYDGKKSLSDKLNMCKEDVLQEPILLSLIKNYMNPRHMRLYERKHANMNSYDNCNDKNCKEDQNCTYILHDSQSSTTSNSVSDNSSDEKNKLHLRLQHDHSDTDTSSDSLRDKSSSEYIPGDHILKVNNNNEINKSIPDKSIEHIDTRSNLSTQATPEREQQIFKDMKLMNSSSDSTSYVELKPFNKLDEQMLNTAGLPVVEADVKSEAHSNVYSIAHSINEVLSPKSGTLSSATFGSLSNEKPNRTQSNENKLQGPTKTDEETSEYSYRDDFSSSPIFKYNDVSDRKDNIKVFDQVNLPKSPTKNCSVESPRQPSESSQSSVSLSDVADLISEKSSLSNTNKSRSRHSPTKHSKSKEDDKISKLCSDDSGDFTESPVPSLSNLSLDIHSD